MASTLANTSNTVFRPYRTPYGSFPIREFEEGTCASTAVIRRGDVVCFDTVVTTGNHRVVRAPSSQGNGGTVLQNGIKSLIGVALTGSTGDGSTTGLAGDGARPNPAKMISVAIADRQTEFLGYISSGGASTAVHISASSYIGMRKAVVYDRTQHAFFIDSTNSTAADFSVIITDIPSESRNDKNGAVIFKFLSTNLALGAEQ